MDRSDQPNREQQPRLTPCGRTRREMLWQMGGGFVSLALATMLDEDGFFGRPALAATERNNSVRNALSPRQPQFPAKAKNCIFIFNYGGVSQVDTFDPKPQLTKHSGERMPNLDADEFLKIRNPGTLLGTRFEFQKHGEAGIEVSSLFPHLAKRIDDLCIIRSCHTDSFAHGSGLLQMNTGFLRQGYPCVGSWVTYGLGTENQNLPGFVVLLDHRGGPIGGAPNWSSGFMPATYQGTQFRTRGEPILHLTPPKGTSSAQRRNQLDLLGKLQSLRGPAGPENAELMSRIASYELAFRMQAEAPEAVDLSKESAETKRLYGLDQEITQKFGRRCLLARRLVERGVRFVQIYSGGGHNDENWDAHGDVVKNHTLHAMETDQPIHALITDLERRGMLDETLIVWTSEFGRTVTAQNGKGRDHSPRGFTSWMAGGGVKGGQVIGATDELGYQAVENRVHVNDLHATMLAGMGLDHLLLTYFHGGRDMRLTDVAGNVVKEVFG